MLTTYRVLSFIFNFFLLVGVSTSIYWQLRVNSLLLNIEDFLGTVLLLYALSTSVYYIVKTSKIYKKGVSVKFDSLDAGLLDDNFVFRFHLDKFISISNILLGLGLIGLGVYTLIFNPIRYYRSEELIRFLVILFAIIYGLLQINYSIRIIRVIRKK